MNVGLDIGYSAVKTVSGDRRVTFPSVVGTPDRARFSLDGNAAIVLTPDVDFILVVFIYYEDGWLGELSFPLFADIATATHNYFNIDHQYVRPDLAAE